MLQRWHDGRSHRDRIIQGEKVINGILRDESISKENKHRKLNNIIKSIITYSDEEKTHSGLPKWIFGDVLQENQYWR